MIGTEEEGKKKRRSPVRLPIRYENVLDRSYTQQRVVAIVIHDTCLQQQGVIVNRISDCAVSLPNH